MMHYPALKVKDNREQTDGEAKKVTFAPLQRPRTAATTTKDDESRIKNRLSVLEKIE